MLLPPFFSEGPEPVHNWLSPRAPLPHVTQTVITKAALLYEAWFSATPQTDEH